MVRQLFLHNKGRGKATEHSDLRQRPVSRMVQGKGGLWK
mgnify:CR=1 FL=1